jgi:hypothetical protein
MFPFSFMSRLSASFMGLHIAVFRIRGRIVVTTLVHRDVVHSLVRANIRLFSTHTVGLTKEHLDQLTVLREPEDEISDATVL